MLGTFTHQSQFTVQWNAALDFSIPAACSRCSDYHALFTCYSETFLLTFSRQRPRTNQGHTSGVLYLESLLIPTQFQTVVTESRTERNSNDETKRIRFFIPCFTVKLLQFFLLYIQYQCNTTHGCSLVFEPVPLCVFQ